MRNVYLNSSVIQRLLSSRPSGSRQPVLTHRKSPAAASAADTEFTIGTASLAGPLPMHFNEQELGLNGGRNFDWYDLFEVADYRSDVSLAASVAVSAANSTLILLYQHWKKYRQCSLSITFLSSARLWPSFDT